MLTLTVFLGNIGEKYNKTRHNAGFLFADYLFPDVKFHEVKSRKCLEYKIGDHIYIKPTTFMNNSGDSALLSYNFYKIQIEDFLVIHDDVDIPLGEYRYTKSSGHAGHHGVEDIMECFGTQDFARIGLGVGKSPDSRITTDLWVLQEFSNEELITLNAVFEKVKNAHFV